MNIPVPNTESSVVLETRRRLKYMMDLKHQDWKHEHRERLIRDKLMKAGINPPKTWNAAQLMLIKSEDLELKVWIRQECDYLEQLTSRSVSLTV